jgi:hypothetical protein
MMNLVTELSRLLPLAIDWAQSQENAIIASGRSLSAAELQVARAVGVQHATKIRIKLVSQLPQPNDPALRAAANQTGLLGPYIAGITFGHGIYIRNHQASIRLLSHECRHVYQYESAGSIAAFLEMYLEPIVTVGYQNAPLEADAKRHERDE